MSVKITPKAKDVTVLFTTPLKEGASQAILTGEWDNWEVWTMEPNKNGSFSIKLNLDLGKSYQFGYSIDGRWCPDETLQLVESPFGTSNSVLDLTMVAAKEKPAAKAATAKPAAKTAAKPAAKKTTAKK